MIVPGSANALMLGQSQGYNLTKSLRFRSSASATLSRTPASASNQQKWTLSAWVKRGTVYDATLDNYIFGAGSSGSNRFLFGFGNTTENLSVVATNSGSNVLILTTSAVYRDPSAWYHMVLSVDTTQATAANRVILYVNGVQVTAFSTATYPAQNTNLVVNATNAHAFGSRGYAASDYYDGYMTEINFVDGQQLTSSSFGSTNALTGVWQPAKYTGTYGTNGFYLPFTDNSSATPTGLGKDYSGTSSNVIVGSATNASTTLTVVSTTGISVGSIVTGTGIPSNTYVTSIGVLQVTLSQAATSTTASTNYTFSGNNWLCNNISLTAGSTYDSMTDVPTLTSATTANYCVLNPLDKYSNVTLSNGNLSGTFSSYIGFVRGTMALPSTGKWYWEGTVPTTDVRAEFGIATFSQALGVDPQAAGSTGCWFWYSNGSASTRYNAGSGASWGSAWTSGDIVGIAFDAGAGTLTYYLNGALQGGGAAATGLTGTYAPMLGFGNNTSTAISMNFGQQPFAQTPPTGFVALNTYNLPTSTIVNGGKYMDATIYTGDGSQTRSFTNTYGFKPDLVWSKIRSGTTQGTGVFDSVRGTSGQSLDTAATTAEGTWNGANASDYGYVSSFDSNGFSVNDGAIATTGGYVNYSTRTYVGWQWQAGQGTTSSNTNGSITSTVSVNASAGFSVVTYTGNGTNGATVGHGLGVAPQMVIYKSRNTADTWVVYHVSLGGGNNYLRLQTTGATYTADNTFNSTIPSSTVLTLGNITATNPSNAMVAYCWAAVPGFSAFGSFTGNGSADGPFVYTGFRPKYIMSKSTSGPRFWFVTDTSRDPYNVCNLPLFPNDTQGETAGTTDFDILSNGFKARTTNAAVNGSGETIIYMAFAENPFKNALAR